MTGALERLDDAIFAPSTYELPVPAIDGRKAVRLELRFAGVARLDDTSADDLALLEAGRLGVEVLLLVRGEFTGRAFKLAPAKDDDERELGYVATVRVLAVEAAEAA